MAHRQAALTQIQLGAHYVAAHAGCRGLCMGCGEELTAQHLKLAPYSDTGAVPDAVLCVDCKEDEERRDALYAQGHGDSPDL